MAKRIRKAVISGGPSGGKGAACQVLVRLAIANGLNYRLIPETATELFRMGWRQRFDEIPIDDEWARMSRFTEFQYAVLVEQIRLEMSASYDLEGDGLIICDRSFHDSVPYIGAHTFEKKLSTFESIFGLALGGMGVSTGDLRRALGQLNSTAILFMRSPAVDCAQSYTLLTNEQRTETPEQAAELDAQTELAWRASEFSDRMSIIGNFPEIPNSEMRFTTKLNFLASEAAALLGLASLETFQWPFSD